MTGINRKTGSGRKLLCLLLAAALCVACALSPDFAVPARAAGRGTSIGLAEQGITAHREGWKYSYGGKGQKVGNTRVSDCAGLIYSYFTDVGMPPPYGNVNNQVKHNCIFTGHIAAGVPNIHGLLVTVLLPSDPSSGVYSHIGIYIGADTVTDNSDYGTNMRRLPINGRGWADWHLMDNGLVYPSNGWYAMDGKMTHYTQYEYDTDTVLDGIIINSEGFAVDEDGKYLPVDQSMLSQEFVPASTVRNYLVANYDSATVDPDDPSYNGIVTGTGVNLRAEPTTKSTVVTVVHRGDLLKITGQEEGLEVTSGGSTSSLWYAVTTTYGKKGYISSLFVARRNVGGAIPDAPAITSDGSSVTITAGDGEDTSIYYTTDGSTPDENSTPYASPVYMTGYTYKAIAVKDGVSSPVTTATVLSNGTIFTDFTFADWFGENINQAVGYGLFRGVGDNRFEPNSNVQRGQFVLVLANIAGVNLDAYSGVTGFTDVKQSAWYAKAVQWAAETGITTGDGNNTFRPEASISRQEMCLFLYRFMGLSPVSSSTPFSDDPIIASWAKDAVYACRAAGIINGLGNNQFGPRGTATRAQACVVAVNCYINR